MKILLASASPRRKKILLKLIGENFLVKSFDVDETFTGKTPEETVIELAHRKLNAVEEQNLYDLIITSDTLVWYDNKYFGKPNSLNDAKKMLLKLGGKTHSVISSILVKYKAKVTYKTCKSFVKIKKLDEKSIDDYIRGYDVLDKAGSYAIQDHVVVEEYTGSYDNIVGFPTEKFIEILYELNLSNLLTCKNRIIE